MPEGDDMTDWAPGQPAPWLAAYGVPPVDSSLAGAPGAPQPELVPPVVDAMAQPVPPLQPGLGIPAAAVDQAAAAPPAPPSFLQQFSGGVADTFSNALPDAAGAIATQARADQTQAAADKQKAADDRTASAVKVATDPTALVGDRQAAWQAIPPEMRASIINSSDPKAMAALATAAMSPEELAQIASRHQQAQIHEEAAQRSALAKKQQEDADRDWQAYQAAHAKTTADLAATDAQAQQIAKQQVDPKEHGVGNFIASVLSGFIGGAESMYTGGRNMALEELDKRTQTRIDAQKANIANQWQGANFKRNIIAEQMQQGADEYRATTTYRLATYDRAIGELQTQMQDYDPQGTTALRGATAVQQIQAARQQAIQAAGQQLFKNNLDAAKVNFDAQKAAQEAFDKAQQRKLEEENSKRSVGATYAGIAAENQRQDKQIAAENFREMLKQGQKDLDTGNGVTAPVQLLDDKGQPLTDAQGVALVQDGKLKNKDGSIWQPPKEGASAELAKKFVNGLAAARTYNAITNEMIRGIKAHGGESEYYKSDDWQNMKALQQAAVAELHDAYGVTSFRESTAEYFEKAATSGIDPTSFLYDASQSLRKSNEILQGRVKSMAKTLNYDGPDIKFQDTSTPAKPVENDTDAANRAASTGSTRATGEYPGGDAGHVAAYLLPGVGYFASLKDTADAILPRSGGEGLTDQQLTGLGVLQNQLGDAKTRQQALDALGNLVSGESVTASVKQKASTILLEDSAANTPTGAP